MRIILFTIMLATLGLAGCLDSDGDPTTPPASDGDSQELMPGREFEPVVNFDVNYFEFEPGDTVELTWSVSDLNDYPYPMTFIDWNITYSGAANPVAEGDGNELPNSYSRVLYKEDFHIFTLFISDGQGFETVRKVIVKVGDPTITIEEAEEAAAQTGSAVYETRTIEESIATEGTCSAGCTFLGTSSGRSLAANACPGMRVNANGVACAWVEIPPGAVGAPFTISDNAGNDPDARALDKCRPNAFQIASYGAIGPESGEILPGTGCLVAWFFEDAEGDILFEVGPFQHAVSGNIPYDREPTINPFAAEPTLTYTSQPARGCLQDVNSLKVQGHGTQCLGLAAGPYSTVNDGVWIPLDPRFEGAAVKTDIGNADARDAAHDTVDTDCLFLDHMLNIVGSAHNGLGPCAGVVSPNAYWMFVYNYLNTPHPIWIEFTLDPGIAAAAEAEGRPAGATLMEGYEERPTHWLNLETGICYVKDSAFTAAAPGFHYVAFGTWFYQESNGIPSLQASGDDLAAETYAGDPGGLDGCTGGDLTAL